MQTEKILLKRNKKLCDDNELKHIVETFQNDINYDYKSFQTILTNRQLKIIRWIIRKGNENHINMLLSNTYYFSRIKKLIQYEKKYNK